MFNSPAYFSTDQFEAFCKKWNINKVELYGSALRGDFTDKSDFDFLFTFSEKAPSLFDFPKIKEELETIVGRKVDINTRNAIENARNPLLKEEILSTVKVVYEQKKS
jgi:predicted nucleotidyltransferase